MSKRVNNDPGDNPDEYWFEFNDCAGTGMVNITDLDADPGGGVSELCTCPECDGLGLYEGDAGDDDSLTASFRGAGHDDPVPPRERWRA